MCLVVYSLDRRIQPLILQHGTLLSIIGGIVTRRAQRDSGDKSTAYIAVETIPVLLRRPASIAWEAFALGSCGRCDDIAGVSQEQEQSKEQGPHHDNKVDGYYQGVQVAGEENGGFVRVVSVYNKGFVAPSGVRDILKWARLITMRSLPNGASCSYRR